MIDIKFIRDNPDAVRTSLNSRNLSGAIVDDILYFDQKHREFLTDLEQLKAKKNSLSGPPTPDQRAELTLDKENIARLTKLEAIAKKQLFLLLVSIPNNIHSDVPLGMIDCKNF